jgi:hypothetical protein
MENTHESDDLSEGSNYTSDSNGASDSEEGYDTLANSIESARSASSEDLLDHTESSSISSSSESHSSDQYTSFSSRQLDPPTQYPGACVSTGSEPAVVSQVPLGNGEENESSESTSVDGTSDDENSSYPRVQKRPLQRTSRYGRIHPDCPLILTLQWKIHLILRPNVEMKIKETAPREEV